MNKMTIALKEDLERHIHSEISLRAENHYLRQRVQKLETQIAKGDEDRLTLEKKYQNLVMEVKQLKINQRVEISYSKKWQVKQVELKNYKERTFALLEKQKQCLERVIAEIEGIEYERDKLHSELKKTEQKLQHILAKHQKIMATKIMKWTGKYWNLRKKLQLKSK